MPSAETSAITLTGRSCFVTCSTTYRNTHVDVVVSKITTVVVISTGSLAGRTTRAMLAIRVNTNSPSDPLRIGDRNGLVMILGDNALLSFFTDNTNTEKKSTINEIIAAATMPANACAPSAV